MSKNPKNGSRRSFLKRSALTSTVVMGSSVSAIGMGSACDEETNETFEEGDFYTAWRYGDEFVDSTCEVGGSSETRITMGCASLYHGSADWGDELSHRFTSSAYAEHYNEDLSTCEWEHGPGIERHLWQAWDEESGNGVETSGSGTAIGVYPPIEENEYNFPNAVFTGLTQAVEYAFPLSSYVLGPAELMAALHSDISEVYAPYPYQKRQEWDYVGQKSCVNHTVKFTSDGPSDTPTVHSENFFSNGYGSASVEMEIDINYPMDPIGNSATATERGGEDSTNADVGMMDGQEVVEGDVVEDNDGREVEITSIKTHTEHSKLSDENNSDDSGFSTDSRGHSSNEVMTADLSEEEFKERYPEFNAETEERGVPERIVKFPARASVTWVEGKYVDRL